jgi:uncharacterized protein YkwD
MLKFPSVLFCGLMLVLGGQVVAAPVTPADSHLIAQTPSNLARFAVGDRLEIQRLGEWRSGQVVGVQQIGAGEVTYNIRYLDVGLVEANVSGDRLRSLSLVGRNTNVRENPDAAINANANITTTPNSHDDFTVATRQTKASTSLTQQLGKIVYVERSGEWQEARLIRWRSSGSSYRYSVKYRQDQHIEENVVPQRIQSLEEARNQSIAIRNMDLSTPAAIQEIVDAHNAWRSPLGLQPLQWSDELAAISLDWAEQLAAAEVMEHSHSPGYGENLAEGLNTFFSPAQVVNLWGDEVADYDYETNTCLPGKMCGHYTQVVWDTTTEVGCATIRKDNNWEIWVCTYNPPGNYVGQRPF